MSIKAVLVGFVAMAAMAVGTLCLTGGEVMAVKCPNGFKKATAPTLAECGIDDTGQQKDLFGTVTKVINVVVSVLGIVAVGVMVMGGVTFVTSQGDAAKVTKAKNTILYGLVGLIVAILAFAIVNFVLKSVFT